MAEYEVSRSERRDLLVKLHEFLESNAPKHKRSYNGPHGGEIDCGSCGYPLTGSVKPDLPPHDKYVADGPFHQGPCEYLTLKKDLKEWIDSLEQDE